MASVTRRFPKSCLSLVFVAAVTAVEVAAGLSVARGADRSTHAGAACLTSASA